MTTTFPADRRLFVTIPVADLERSTAFFASLGFSFDPAFSGEGAACMVVNDHTSVMLGQRDAFAELSHVPVGDPLAHALALFSFSVPTRDEVDAVSSAALAAGGREADGAEDHGFMYTRSFFDLDGHGWQVMWLSPEATDEAEPAAVDAAS